MWRTIPPRATRIPVFSTRSRPSFRAAGSWRRSRTARPLRWGRRCPSTRATTTARHGRSWPTSRPPPHLSSDSKYAKYTSNWTNPYLYVLPQNVGNLSAGTLLLASIVSGDDYYYQEQKAANSSWTPSGDGDRKDVALALYSSTDDGATWSIQNIIATGGWQGGSAGSIGRVSNANTSAQVDPLWEPHLVARNGTARRLLLRRERLPRLQHHHRSTRPSTRPTTRRRTRAARSSCTRPGTAAARPGASRSSTSRAPP